MEGQLKTLKIDVEHDDDDGSSPPTPQHQKESGCAICSEPFSSTTQKLAMKIPFGSKDKVQRNSHTCRVCARDVCEVPKGQGAPSHSVGRSAFRAFRLASLEHRLLVGSQVAAVKSSFLSVIGIGNQNTTPLVLIAHSYYPKHRFEPQNPETGVRSKKVAAKRKPDPSRACEECAARNKKIGGSGCSCGFDWLCVDCSQKIKGCESKQILSQMEAAFKAGDELKIDALASEPEVAWLLELDNHDAEEIDHYVKYMHRARRFRDFLSSGSVPVWPRPDQQTRKLQSQIKHSIISGAMETANEMGGTQIKTGIKALKLAVGSYKISEILEQYILSEEFISAWNVLLDQLAIFVTEDEGDSGGYAKKAKNVFALTKRMYYYSLWVKLQAITKTLVQPEGQICPRNVLIEANKYIHITEMIYKCSKGARKTKYLEKEAQWFLDSFVSQERLILLEFIPKTMEEQKARSENKGVKCPAFALILDPESKRLLCVVRGTQERKDQLIDLDFTTEVLLQHKCNGFEVNHAWNLPVHKGMARGARYILESHGVKNIMMRLPADYGIDLIGHSLGSGTAALIGAMLLSDPGFKTRDIKIFGFGTPACVCPQLSKMLQENMTSVVHREDVVPRLSFNNLVNLRKQFNDPDMQSWVHQQEIWDEQSLWNHLGFDGKKKDSEPTTSTPANSKNVAGDLVIPGKIIYLRQHLETGQYEAILTDHAHPDLQRIMLAVQSVEDHYLDSTLTVLRGLCYRRFDPFTGDEKRPKRKLQSAKDEAGSWRPCSVCKRDPAELYILRSDAHRANATHHCGRCGMIVCVECCPAGDKVPDFYKELWATRKLEDKRVVMSELGTLEPQRLCIRCRTMI